MVGPQGLLHTVLDGETMYLIATQYGVTVADVAAANGIADPTLIFAGQQLIIPGVQPPQLALDLPEPVQSLTVEPLILVEGRTGRFRVVTTKAVSLSGTFLDRPLNVIAEQENTLHTMLVGIPIFTAPGVYPLKLNLSDPIGPQTPLLANIQIVAGSYGSEYINLLSDRAELLDPNVEGTEQTLVESIMSGLTSTRYFNGLMGLPAAAMLTSPFGTRRAYDGGAFDHFHMGADFAGAPGAPVLAAAGGVVVMANTLNVRGNATIIDHGWGVFTGYWHQTDLYVQPGDVVTAGQVIGTIGSTGRVTGPHLHWELWVSGVPVDPMQWVRESFS
jgi:murein DD-endopeptidase MepM/ murein hydrolase activator NlpD